ncbi:MAG: tyrosine-type recombinase/integrase, partial [Candidatus Margulisbacteria bacterium]|nr:tyrosine-type recombinase/integrase [Candidatus Margulisiibacteriota bacterium]
RLLPLPHDVGVAIYEYLKHERPATSSRSIFLHANAPYLPLMDSSAISKIVRRTMIHVGLDNMNAAAHLLRHSAATKMVCKGATFKDVADVLGHQSLQTTGIYAKLDLDALSLVALPWPGDTL